MSRKNQEMIMKERLVRERDNLLREREALENKIAGLELAISLIGEQQDAEVLQSNARRVATKSVVLELLHDVGLTGLNANNAVDMAARRGIELDKASVSSLLSRLKKEETLTYDGEKYRLLSLTKPSIGSPFRVFKVMGTDGKTRLIRRREEPETKIASN